jgi:signal transduction histidine kinase
MVLQKRISLALVTVIMVFVVAQGYLAYRSLEEQEDHLVDEVLATETRRLIERIRAGELPELLTDRPLRLGPNLSAWLVPSDLPAPGDEGTVSAESKVGKEGKRGADGTESTEGVAAPPPYLAGLTDGAHMLLEGDRVYHAMIEPIAEGRLFVRFDATQNEEFVYRFGRYLVVTSLLCIVLGWLMSAFVARIVVSPFRRMSERLRNWSQGERWEPVAGSDEETMLLQAFDRAQRRLEESLVREREFAANVRHEVRTPLAALRTDAEMILLTETLSAPGAGRLRRIMAAVDSLATEIDALQALSTASPGEAEPVLLAQCVDEVWESLRHLADRHDAAIENRIPRTDTAILDRLALVTILRNLLRNAIEHASPGTCRVVHTSDGLLIADEGPGIRPDDRPFVFDRYFQGAFKDSPAPIRRDSGLGLAIARQTADLRGWSLDLEPEGERGTVFSLRFR